MKTTIAIITALITLNFSKAQTSGSHIMIWNSLLTDTLCPGDTLYVPITWDGNTTDTTYFRMELPPSTQVVKTYSFANSYFSNLTTSVVSPPSLPSMTYTVYWVKIKTDPNWPIGTTWFRPDFGGELNVYFKRCEITGISELSIDPAQVIYYDLNGNRTEKKYNTVLIEQVGLQRKKTLILE